MPKDPKDPNAAWGKAETIGASQVGERYAEPTNPGVLDLVRQMLGLGPQRPPSVVAQDPYGDQAFLKGAGPAPMMMGSIKEVGGIPGWHASPHDFTQFDNSKIGTGVGAQTVGYGHYNGGSKAVGEHYVDQLSGPTLQVGGRIFRDPEAAANRLSADPNNRDLWQGTHDAVEHLLSGKKIDQGLGDLWTFESTGAPVKNMKDLLAQAAADPQGYHAGWAQIQKMLQRGAATVPDVKAHLYKTEFNADPASLLKWDRPFAEQSPQVQESLQNLMPQDWKPNPNVRGESIYRNISERNGGERGGGFPKASEELLKQGVPGLTYKDYELGHDANNHVVFQDKMLAIVKKLYGVATAATIGKYLASQEQGQQ